MGSQGSDKETDSMTEKKKLIWLVCPSCGVKEALMNDNLTSCSTCGVARHAEDEDGVPQVLWSSLQDPSRW